MKKFDATIHALAKALYETRSAPGAPFDPQYALGELAHAGAHGAMALLATRCQLGGFVLSFDKARMKKILGDSPTPQADELYLKYWDAMLQHPAFTDVLGLANEVMSKTYDVGWPNYFLSSEARAFFRHIAHVQVERGLPLFKGDEDVATSGVLASLTALLDHPEQFLARRVRILLFCQGDLGVRFTLMQLFSPLTNFMQFVEWAKIAEGTEGNATHLFSVQRQHHVPAIAL